MIVSVIALTVALFVAAGEAYLVLLRYAGYERVKKGPRQEFLASHLAESKEA